MDRLQQAISKARSERAAAVGQSGAIVPDVAEAPRPQKRPVATPVNGTQNPISARWGEFEPLELSARTLRRNRLEGYSAGESAIPYDMLRTKILQRMRKNNWKRLALVSPESGSGKTTVTANLGFSFSRMREKRTMVFDFDLRRVGLARMLDQKCKRSMSDVLERKIPFAEHGLCHDGNVVFGLNRERVQNPSELLQSPTTTEVLDEIEAYYQPDLMLFDTPPLMVSDDSQGFLQSVDCALLIVAAEITPMDRIDVAERQLSELTNVMGIVLNRCRHTGGAHGYENEYY